MTVGIKEKERSRGRVLVLLFVGSIIQSGENVKLPPCSLCFPPILLILIDSLTSQF